MNIELENEINEVLKECNRYGWVNIHYHVSDMRRKAIQEAKVLEIIQHKSKQSYELTFKGKKVIELGGISQYLKDLKSKERKDDEIKNLTIKQLEGNIFQLKYWWVFLLISGVIGFLTGNIELILGWLK